MTNQEIISEIMSDHGDENNEWYADYFYQNSKYLELEPDQECTWIYDDETSTMTRSLIYFSNNHDVYVSVTEQREFSEDGWLYFPPVIELLDKSESSGDEIIWTILPSETPEFEQ